jgi:signal transduction histidine kinase
MRGRFMWRVGAFVVVMLLVLLLLGAAVLWALATLLGTQASTLLAGLLVILTVSFIGRRLVREVRGSALPAADLMEAAGRVESGDYTARVREQGPRELRALGSAFNTMSARLEATEEERRRLLADVSHELRTPLTVIAGNLEGLLDGVYPADAAHLRTILEETRILERLVEDLRTLSESEAGVLQLHREPTDLARLLHEVADGFRAQADVARVALETSAGDLPTLELDATRIRAVVGNLLANALRYTPAGGHVSVKAERAGDAVAVTVADTGAGIEPDALAHVFDRFYRSLDSPGSGLGLAIARSLVEAHGGTISAASAGPAGGTAIRFTLPIAA